MVQEGCVSMGYQEAFRPIEHLAEAAGIKKAIEDYKHHPDLPEYCNFYCASREKATGNLYACIGGQRCRVHIIAGKDLDYCIPYDAPYADYYEDVDKVLVEEAARERPDLVEKGYRDAAADFERAAEWERERRRKEREAAEALKPLITSFLKEFGPATQRELYAMPSPEEHSVDDALRRLLYQDYLSCHYKRNKTLYWFADETIAGSFEDALASAPTIEEKIERVLERESPLSVWKISFRVEASDSSIRKALRSLAERGKVAVDKTGSVYMYSLVGSQPT